jgi:hypothetical protein
MIDSIRVLKYSDMILEIIETKISIQEATYKVPLER